MRRYYSFIPIFACAALIASCNNDVPVDELDDAVDETEVELVPLEDIAEQITIEDFEYTLRNGVDRVVSGVVYNPTDRNVRHAEVRVGFYDEDNVLVETISISLRQIGAGERKRFRQTVDTPVDYPSARVREIMVVR